MKMDQEVGLRETLKELTNSNVSVRINAAKILSWIGNESAIAPLIEALKDSNDGVRYQAARSLKKLTPKDLGENYNEWREWHVKIRGM